MINHKDLMYWITKEEYIKILKFVKYIEEINIPVLEKKYEKEYKKYQEVTGLGYRYTCSSAHTLQIRLERTQSCIEAYQDKIDILNRTNINNINFIFDSEEMELFKKYIDSGQTDINLNVVKE